MLLFLLACASPAPEPTPTAVEAAPVEAAAPEDLGARVFAERCATCHGAEGKGDGPAAAGLTTPPKDLSRPRLPEERRPPSREEIIKSGVPNTAMVGFADVLSAAELEAVTRHVHQLAHPGGVPMDCAGGNPDCVGGGQGHGPQWRGGQGPPAEAAQTAKP